MCDGIHWVPVNWYIYDISLAFVSSSIIFSLHDVVHEYFDVGDESIEGKLERSYCFFKDDNVIFFV